MAGIEPWPGSRAEGTRNGEGIVTSLGRLEGEPQKNSNVSLV